MRRSPNKNFWLSILLVTASFFVLTGMGKCGGGSGGRDAQKKIVQCVDAPPSNCAAYKQNDGASCELDPNTNKCRAKLTTQSDCQKIGDKDECQKNDRYLYQNDKCDKAAENEAGTCAAIKVDTICNAHESSKDKKKCVWDAGKCVNKPVVISEYALSKVDNTAAGYGIPDDKLAGISASKDGWSVYLIGTKKNTFKAFSVADSSWADALGDFTAIPDAYDVGTKTSDKDFSGAAVSSWAPLSDGILLWINGKGAVQLVGAGAGQSFALPYPTENATGLGEITKPDGTTFLYASIGAPGNNVAFLPKNSNINVSYGANWDDTLVQDGNTGGVPIPIQTRYGQFLPFNGGMLMVAENGIRADLIKNGNIGITKRWIINSNNGTGPQPTDHSGEVNYLTVDNNTFMRAGKDNLIKKLAMLDKYLVAVFDSNGPNTGGIALFDTTNPQKDAQKAAANWKWLISDIAATDILVDNFGPMKNKRAIITAKTGFLILEEDKLIEPVAGLGFISNHANTDKKAVTSGATPKSGFAGAQLPAALAPAQSYVGVAQDKDGHWYIAIKGSDTTDGGVFTLDIKEVTTP